MRTTFFALALCAATTMAVDLSNVESELKDLDTSSLTDRALIDELDLDIIEAELPETSTITRRLDTSAVEISSIESELPKLDTSALTGRAALDTATALKDLDNGATSVTDSTVKDVNDLTSRSLDASSATTSELPLPSNDLLDSVVASVEKILDSDDLSSQDKLQETLNTIINSIEARGLEEKRSSLAGLDLSVLDSASLEDLLDDLECLLEEMMHEVMPMLRSASPSLAKELKKLMREVHSMTNEFDSDSSLLGLGLSKRSLLGLDMSTIEDLDLSSLVADIMCMVEACERALTREMKSMSPSLAKEMKSLFSEINSMIDQVTTTADM